MYLDDNSMYATAKCL